MLEKCSYLHYVKNPIAADHYLFSDEAKQFNLFNSGKPR